MYSCRAALRHDGDASVRLWNWHTRAVVVTHVFEGLQRPIAVALHPSGNVLLVGFEEQIRLYHVCEDNLLLAFEIPVKGVVTLRDGESILVANPLSTVAFAHGGHFFAAVTGRLVQVFALYESSKGGKPGLIHILRGHAASQGWRVPFTIHGKGVRWPDLLEPNLRGGSGSS